MATGRPRIETWSNGGSSTLNGGITAGATSLTVTSATSFPAYPDFKIKINDEVLTVTAISGNVFTVERAVDDTAAAAHSDGDTVTNVVTRDGLERAFQDNYGIDYSDGYPYNRILAEGVTKTASDFTWLNQGSATCVDADDGGLILQTNVSENLRQVRGKYLTAPSTPWTCTCFVLMGPGMKNFSGGHGLTVGLFARESSTGKLYVLNMRTDSIQMEKQSSVTAYNGAVDSYIDNLAEAIWFRLGDDGTDMTGEVSHDGKNWQLCFDEPRGTYMTGGPGPDQVGFYMSNGQSAADTPAYFKSWILE